MSRRLKGLFFLTLLLAVQPGFAQLENDPVGALNNDQENGMDDGLAEQEMVRIVTDQARPEDCLAAVAINRIDGEPRVVSAQGFLIEPGPHSLNGLAKLDITHCSITGDDHQINTAADLEFNFEAGQTYYVGYYHRSQLSDERRLVVWKVEQSPPSEGFIQ